MTNAYKLYLHSGKYRIIDEKEFILIAKQKIIENYFIQKKYANIEINKLAAFNIYKLLSIKILPVNAFFINIKDGIDPTLKTIEKMEEDIEKFIFTQIKEDANSFSSYLNGSKEAMIEILEDKLFYNTAEENDRTLSDFIEKEIYFRSEINYKKNVITIELTKNKFICDLNTQKIYKYKSTIKDKEEYQFNFRKNELFRSREEAISESKKLIDENYNLPMKNSKIQKIIVRTDDKNTIIVFWPDVDTHDEYIMANDIIGTSDLAGDTKTSLLFFNDCKEPTPEQIQTAKDVIAKCMNLQTYNVKHL